MRLRTKVAYNTIIQVASKAIATMLGLVAIAVMTRYLGQTGFGQYTTIITFISFFGIIVDFGLTLVTVQMISQPGADEDKIINNLFSLRLVSAIILLGAAPLIVIFLPYEPVVKLGVAITSLAFLFIALNQILVGLFQKNLRMDKVSIAEVAGRIILVIGVIVAIKMDFGLLGIMIATVLASAINFFLHFSFSRSFVRIRLRFDFYIWKDIIKRSWPLALTIAFNLIYLKADTLILSLIKTQAEVGIYGAAYKVVDVLVTLPFMFAGIILPIMTFYWAENRSTDFKNVLQKAFDFMAILAIPLIIGTQFVARQVMIIVAGEDFAVSGSALRILIISAGLIFLGCMFSHAIIALEKQKKIIGAYIFTSLTALAGYLIFIPRFSYFGAAWVTIYSELVIAIAAGYYVYKYSKFLPNFKIVIKSLLASLVMASIIYFIPISYYQAGFGMTLTLSFAVLIYFSSLYLFKGITKKDLTGLLNK
ncbi:MAG: flippase [Patescibacteria group bacterium]